MRLLCLSLRTGSRRRGRVESHVQLRTLEVPRPADSQSRRAALQNLGVEPLLPASARLIGRIHFALQVQSRGVSAPGFFAGSAAARLDRTILDEFHRAENLLQAICRGHATSEAPFLQVLPANHNALRYRPL